MAIHLTKSQAKQFGVRLEKTPQEKKPRRADGYDSQLEASYAAYLSANIDVQSWRYHPWQFVLVPGKKPVRYTPDFLVIHKGNIRWQIIEIKGFWRPKDRVIMKLCAERWPEFQVLGVTRVYGMWDWEVF